MWFTEEADGYRGVQFLTSLNLTDTESLDRPGNDNADKEHDSCIDCTVNAKCCDLLHYSLCEGSDFIKVYETMM